MHHGILGQRWGRKNGPPYPLGASDHSASEKKAGWRRSLDRNEKSTSLKEHKAMSSSTKKKIAVGAGIAASVLAAGVGAYYLNKSGALDSLIKKGQKVGESVAKSSTVIEHKEVPGVLKYDSKLQAAAKDAGFAILKTGETEDQCLKNASPNRKSDGMFNSCVPSGISGFFRSKGIDIIPKSTGRKQQSLMGVAEDIFGYDQLKGKSQKYEGPASKLNGSVEGAKHFLVDKFGDNAEGVMSIQWKSRINAGHAFNFKIKDGAVDFIDYREGIKGEEVNAYFNRIDYTKSMEAVRLDNLNPNFDALKRWVYTRK